MLGWLRRTVRHNDAGTSGNGIVGHAASQVVGEEHGLRSWWRACRNVVQQQTGIVPSIICEVDWVSSLCVNNRGGVKLDPAYLLA